ncbi:MAG TPA: sulfotransferase, partial [Cyclobacteriaceae bacterium]|nr:sulfotransferase [Cyclobacteriaceae bacterium]
MNIRYRLRDFLNLPTHTVLGIDLLNWFHLLWKNRFAVSIWYIPKALFITGNVLLNAPLQWFEHIRFNKKIKEAKVESPVFILGHPRSGTTYLQYVLSKDPSFAYCTTTQGLTPHIFLSAEKFAERILKAAMPETRPQDNVKAGATLPIEEEFAMGSISHTSWVHGLYFPK